jgi:hypothetical protein
MFFRFRRMRAMDPLQVAMTGVRMGERYLQVFCSDAELTGGLASKTGLSGVAALQAPDEAQASRARLAGGKAGALIEVRVAPVTAFDWPDWSFDMVVVDDTGGGFAVLSASDRASCLAALRRVLRPGGRAELIERVGGGMFGAPRPDAAYVEGGGAEGALGAAGFKPVRLLGEKAGFRFVEGLNPQSTRHT